MYPKSPTLALLAFCVFAGGNAHAVTVTLETGWPVITRTLRASAADGTPGQLPGLSHVLTTIPEADSLSQSQGRASSSMDFSFQTYGIGALFSADFDLMIESGNSPIGAIADAQGSVYFSVDEDTSYTISGNIAGTGPDMDFYLSGGLRHSAPSFANFDFYEYGFQNPVPTLASPQANLAFGNGSLYDPYNGSLTGTLYANQVYSFGFRTFIKDDNNTGGAASGSGQIQLLIGAPAQNAPDAASTLGLLLVAFAGLAAIASSRLMSRQPIRVRQ